MPRCPAPEALGQAAGSGPGVAAAAMLAVHAAVCVCSCAWQVASTRRVMLLPLPEDLTLQSDVQR